MGLQKRRTVPESEVEVKVVAKRVHDRPLFVGRSESVVFVGPDLFEKEIGVNSHPFRHGSSAHENSGQFFVLLVVAVDINE